MEDLIEDVFDGIYRRRCKKLPKIENNKIIEKIVGLVCKIDGIGKIMPLSC